MFDNFWSRLGQYFAKNSAFLAEGLKLTLIIGLSGFVIGLIIATIMVIPMTYPKPKLWLKIVNKILDIYIWITRGTPVVVILLLFFYVFLTPLQLPALFIGILVFSMLGSSYMAEILRGAVNSIDKGQYEAGRALGLSNWSIMWRIILPQAYINTIPSLGNVIIALVKDTSVVSFITIIDVTKATQFMVAKTYEAVVPYISLALIYLLITGIITLIIKLVEKRLLKRL